ncbi:hypothetical protein P3L51_35770 [Streptomyces sp. PSRA5]|uniref:hypothetical protein n=1 Tax=Streptomyces panacea TaxID=3035064 RepID=UPI00339D111B
MTRALGQVPAAARDHIAATLHTHAAAHDGPGITQDDATEAATAIVLALRADGWHITAPTRQQRP